MVRSFNNPFSVDIPQIGSIVLRSVGFEVVTMVGFNLAKVVIKDITIKISHNGFVYIIKV